MVARFEVLVFCIQSPFHLRLLFPWTPPLPLPGRGYYMFNSVVKGGEDKKSVKRSEYQNLHELYLETWRMESMREGRRSHTVYNPLRKLSSEI